MTLLYIGPVILDLMVMSTLFVKNVRKCSQSSLEKTGTGGGARLTRVFMTENSAFGLFLLIVIKLEKYAALTDSTFWLYADKRSD